MVGKKQRKTTEKNRCWKKKIFLYGTNQEVFIKIVNKQIRMNSKEKREL